MKPNGPRVPLTKSEQMARVRSRNTGPEVALRSALHRAGLRFALRSGLPGSPDVAFVRQRVAVFVDGCFWHGCQRHYTRPVANASFWSQKLRRNVERDRRADADLALLGWSVVRIWEHDVLKSLDVTVARVQRILRRREASAASPSRRRGRVAR